MSPYGRSTEGGQNTNMNCLFCQIAQKAINSEIIYEDEKTLAFLDIHPKAPGHAMVIPKEHAENILDLPESSVKPVFLAVKKVARSIKEALKPSGFTIGINHGRVSGQVVDHLHVHVIPRFDKDGGRSIHSVVDNPPKESIGKIAEKIRNIKH